MLLLMFLLSKLRTIRSGVSRKKFEKVPLGYSKKGWYS